jgi:uncharacterized membrane protein YbhN (UPF0104 family)
MRLPWTVNVAWRFSVSVGLLVSLGWWLDGRAVLAQLENVDFRWLLIGFVVSFGQTVLSAWRWRYTARRLGLTLSLRDAVREYYLAIFINQVCPGGIVGDLSRAWRHARTTETGPAVRAVILERLSGQMVMIFVSLGAVAALPEDVIGNVPFGWFLLVILSLVTVVVMTVIRRRSSENESLVDKLLHDTRVAVCSREALPSQLISSCIIVASYLVTFIIAARAIGSYTPLATLVPLIPIVLLAMLLPISIAGWGVREGVAALLWAAAGLSAVEGAAISAAYGLLILISSLPGAVALLVGLRTTQTT